MIPPLTRAGIEPAPLSKTFADALATAPDLEMPLDIDRIKGFLSPAEGGALYHSISCIEGTAPALEIGSYCGKSSLYLGLGCQHRGRKLFAVDHHRGSEEHQPGELFHDPQLVNDDGHVDTLRSFRQTMRRASLDDTVIPVLTQSAVLASVWQGPLALVFIDGGHSLDAALADYRGWARHIHGGGLLAIHDVYPNSEDGGQAPITVYRLALASGLFQEVYAVDSLRLLQRLT